MDYQALADYLFSDVTQTPDDLEKLYPPRSLPEGAKVTRMAPSPTGFMHLGNLYGAIADERLAHQSDGVFYLRIEDTDQKREVLGGVNTILRVFEEYKLLFDEGVTEQGDKGNYGPYRQRLRENVYHVCAKWLVQQGMAYPCFLTEEELKNTREEQAASKENFGCYGSYAIYRNTALDEIRHRIENEGQKYVLRYSSPGDSANKMKMTDLVRGKLEFPENDQDVVILKSDGIPTYHFAHIVDDHFMRTTHVVRGEEWLATLPIHLQLFAAMGWRAPKYLHTAHLMKQEGESRRKLSKRKDPELALEFYKECGYTVDVLKEYLLLLLNSNFEEWRMANPDANLDSFPFSIKKMSVSGALFDMDKLNDISRTVLCRMSADAVYTGLVSWAEEFAPEFAALLKKDKSYALSILAIGRGVPKPRKDLTTWVDAQEYMDFFFDDSFKPDYAAMPENVSMDEAKGILAAYGDIYSSEDDSSAWFAKIKVLAETFGYTADMKAYKKSPESFKGNVGDVSMVLRVAVTGKKASPDLCEVMRILGKEKVMLRMQQAAKVL